MKKIGIILMGILAPFVAWGYTGDDLRSIELRYNFDVRGHTIVYAMNDGVKLKSNLATSAQSESKTNKRIYNVTVNTPAFSHFDAGEIEAMFDWDVFNKRRVLVHSVIGTVLDTDIDIETKLELMLLKQTY